MFGTVSVNQLKRLSADRVMAQDSLRPRQQKKGNITIQHQTLL